MFYCADEIPESSFLERGDLGKLGALFRSLDIAVAHGVGQIFSYPFIHSCPGDLGNVGNEDDLFLAQRVRTQPACLS